MKHPLLTLLGLLLCITATTFPALAHTPKEVCGFGLGDDISLYKHRVNMDSALSIRYFESLKEVEILPIHGFKSGLIAYSTCIQPNRILRIKLKYIQSSKKFYNQLLSKFKQSFGYPTKWQGDPFHVVIAWKWSFTTKDGEKITLVLQHNTQDRNQKMGNSIKLTYSSLMQSEASCFESNNPRKRIKKALSASQTTPKNDWDLYLPK